MLAIGIALGYTKPATGIQVPFESLSIVQARACVQSHAVVCKTSTWLKGLLNIQDSKGTNRYFLPAQENPSFNCAGICVVCKRLDPTEAAAFVLYALVTLRSLGVTHVVLLVSCCCE